MLESSHKTEYLLNAKSNEHDASHDSDYAPNYETIFTNNSSYDALAQTLSYLSEHFDALETLSTRVLKAAQANNSAEIDSSIGELISIIRKSGPYLSSNNCCGLYLRDTFSRYLRPTALGKYKIPLFPSNEYLANNCPELLTDCMQQIIDCINKILCTEICIDSSFEVHVPDYTPLTKKPEQLYIFRRLKYLIEFFREYFSILIDADKIFQKIRKEQFSAMLLTSEKFRLCFSGSDLQSLSSVESFTKLYRIHLGKGLDITTSNFADEATNKLYERFKNALDSDNNDEKDKISSEIQKYYPMETIRFFNTTVTQLDSFENMLAFEFYNMIRYGYYVRRCQICNTVFTSQKLNVRYCNAHRGKHTSYQKKCTNKTPIDQIYYKYYYRLHKQKGRNTIEMSAFEKWNAEARELRDQYAEIALTQSDSEKFKHAMDELVHKYFPNKKSRK
jgi:hypothetical protein